MTENHVDPERFAQAVADVIEALRWEKRIPSKRQLAERAGLTHTYLYKRLDGEKPFDVEDLAKLAGVLGVRPDDIINRAAVQMDLFWSQVDIEVEEDRLTAIVKPLPTRRPHPSDFDDAEQAARNEDQEKPRLD